MKSSIYSLLLLLVFSISSCSSDSDDTESEIVDSGTTNDITYIADVKSIIDSNCLNCHSNPTSNGASVSLTTLSSVKSAIQNNQLINRINSAEGASGFMPLGSSKLSEAQITVITDWQAGGFQ